MRGRSVNNTRVIVEPNVLLYFLFTLFRLWKNAHFVPRYEKWPCGNLQFFRKSQQFHRKQGRFDRKSPRTGMVLRWFQRGFIF
jgi:hypothetical protein